MKLFVLFAQRICSYDGEFAPEPMEVTDEYGVDEVPEYMEKKTAELIETGEFSAVKLIEVILSTNAETAVVKALNGNTVVVGDVK